MILYVHLQFPTKLYLSLFHKMRYIDQFRFQKKCWCIPPTQYVLCCFSNVEMYYEIDNNENNIILDKFVHKSIK